MNELRERLAKILIEAFSKCHPSVSMAPDETDRCAGKVIELLLDDVEAICRLYEENIRRRKREKEKP